VIPRAAADQAAQLPLDLAASRRVERPARGFIVGGPFDGRPFVLLEMRRDGERSFPFVRTTRADAWPFAIELLVKPPVHLVPEKAWPW
jgi:hypothetical protein